MGGIPADEAVYRNREQGRTFALQQTGGLGERMRTLNVRSLDVLRAHPGTTARVALQNAREAVLAGWDYFPRQLPRSRSLRDTLVAAARVEAWFKVGSLLVGALFCGVAVGLAALRPTTAHRACAVRCAVLAVPYLYFVLFAATTFWTGSRIMYPVEFVPMLLMTMASRELWILSARVSCQRAGLRAPRR